MATRKNRKEPTSDVSDLVVFQAKSGALELRKDVSAETLWASQAQIASIFDVTPQNITQHIRAIYGSGELTESATCKKYLQVQKEGKRTVRRAVIMYNVDVMIAVGYRINSVLGTRFRQWATKTLREHITKGFTLNRAALARNYDAFIQAVSDVRILLPKHATLPPEALLSLVEMFADTWLSLDAYDKQELGPQKLTPKQVRIEATDLRAGIAVLKKELLAKGEATELFAQEHTGRLEGIVGNVLQQFGGNDVYPSLEEKAAHLLYFMVKDHPYIDGNKRSGAYAFVWFLRRAGILNMTRVNPNVLTVLTLFIAESVPEEKDRITALITALLAGPRVAKK